MLTCKANSLYENYYIRILPFNLYNNGVILNSTTELLHLQSVYPPFPHGYIFITNEYKFIIQGTQTNTEMYQYTYYKLQTTPIHMANINN